MEVTIVEAMYIHRNGIEIRRRGEKKPRILFCPFNNYNKGGPFEYVFTGTFAGTCCGPWCACFGGPEPNGYGGYDIDIGCGQTRYRSTDKSDFEDYRQQEEERSGTP